MGPTKVATAVSKWICRIFAVATTTTAAEAFYSTMPNQTKQKKKKNRMTRAASLRLTTMHRVRYGLCIRRGWPGGTGMVDIVITSTTTITIAHLRSSSSSRMTVQNRRRSGERRYRNGCTAKRVPSFGMAWCSRKDLIHLVVILLLRSVMS
jgi:hypothetical protein